MITGINHITLATADLSVSIQFYSSLGFKAHVRWDQGAYLSLEDLWLCLSKGDVDEKNDYSHIAFSIEESDFEKMAFILQQGGVKEWKANSSEGKSLYFLDPSGHKLEIHIGSLKSRLMELKEKPYSGLEWLTGKT